MMRIMSTSTSQKMKNLLRKVKKFKETKVKNKSKQFEVILSRVKMKLIRILVKVKTKVKIKYKNKIHKTNKKINSEATIDDVVVDNSVESFVEFIKNLESFSIKSNHFYVDIAWFNFFIDGIQLWFSGEGFQKLDLIFLHMLSFLRGIKLGCSIRLVEVMEAWHVITPCWEWGSRWGRGSWEREWQKVNICYGTFSHVGKDISDTDASNDTSEDTGDKNGNLEIDPDVVVTKETETSVGSSQCLNAESHACTVAKYLDSYQGHTEFSKFIHVYTVHSTKVDSQLNPSSHTYYNYMGPCLHTHPLHEARAPVMLPRNE